MSTKSKKQERRKPEWVGDSALMFLTRLILVERYPDFPLAVLNRHMGRVVTNQHLKLCAQKLKMRGTDYMEEHIYHLIQHNGLKGAKKFVEALIDILPAPVIEASELYKENACENK